MNFHLCIHWWDLICAYACKSHTGSNSCIGNITIISKKNSEKGQRSELKHSIYRCQIFRYAYVSLEWACLSGRCERKGTTGKAQSHNRIRQDVVEVEVEVGLPRSQLTHVGVSFTRLRRINSAEIYRGLFLDKTQLATPLSPSLCKVFLLKKCMNGGGDSECGSHALLTRLHNPSHDSRSG